MTLPQMLASGHVSAAGALGSLGLFAASQSGIPSFRFVLTNEFITMNFLEEFSIVIKNSSDLVMVLQSLEHYRKLLASKISNTPFKGRSIDRMEELALSYLRSR